MDTHAFGLATLAASDPDLATNVKSLFVIALIAACVPLVVGLLRLKVAEVVLLIGCGVIFGPQALGWIDVNDTTNTFKINHLWNKQIFSSSSYSWNATQNFQ